MNTIDRKHRTVLAEAIREFLEGGLNTNDFEDACQLVARSEDPTIRYVLDQLYDCDFELHFESPDKFSKYSWDQLQRYLLVLESERGIEEARSIRWSSWQLVAVGGTALFATLAHQIGFIDALWWFSIPFGLLSLMISRKSKPKKLPYEDVITPFESFSSLSETYEQVGDFVKMRFPKSAPVDHRSEFVKKAIQTNLIFFWTVVFPTMVLLPFQMFPRFEQRTFVR